MIEVVDAALLLLLVVVAYVDVTCCCSLVYSVLIAVGGAIIGW